ncbi:MAG: hypothetical protein J5787_08120 [Alphaproteobacteria bacterium]|nr:hypothetical protein [Alphaproteobacteria bacterium]MBO4644232.1 hypothetical protein [Alphaproteobacteria bacterium]
MPVSTLIFAGIIGVSLIAVIFYTAYDLGRAKEKIEHERQKSNATAQARLLRTCLDDPAVVRRLHDTFKR